MKDRKQSAGISVGHLRGGSRVEENITINSGGMYAESVENNGSMSKNMVVDGADGETIQKIIPDLQLMNRPDVLHVRSMGKRPNILQKLANFARRFTKEVIAGLLVAGAVAILAQWLHW
ncbi:hypothetical protein [Nocardia mexicana]|uniref:hypothetical protein n=1 Tax=Nocardia mexicana TaxID=279262 RepID=UPI0011C06B19|nr:hypothetical protein [Nocardia mexicana]